jgi:pseudouridine synthase
LLLLTNDGALCERLTHPRYHVEKAYRVKVSGTPDGRALERLRAGLWLEDGKTAPAAIRVEHGRDDKTWLELRLHEGRNRQVRRMLEAVGLRVEKLRRTTVGPLRLGSLRTGEVRPLSAKEVASLRRAVDL